MLCSERLGLGTVQWGMNYGIANRVGQTPTEEVRDILNIAKKNGINLLDTARVYGNSEHVLGENDCLALGFDIVTKTQPLKGLAGSPDEKADIIEHAFRSSLNLLGGTYVYGLLVHHADDLLGEAGKVVWARLSTLKKDGVIKKIGCSIYNPEQFNRLIELYDLDIVQLPYSIYDQRFVKSGLADRVKEMDIEVHARSAFLQGILLMPPEKLPSHFAPLSEHHAALWDAYIQSDLSPVDAALGFCLSCQYIDKVIVGCEQVSQWNEILKASSHSLSSDVIAVLETFAIENENFIDPSCWVQ